jgi:uncharacterized protein YebE (UPF0316 family)
LRPTFAVSLHDGRLDVRDVLAALAPALLIALLRTMDVTLNVFKTVAIIQGRRVAAPILQGAESLMWLLAAGIVFAEMTPIRITGFAVGVMAGTLVGMEVVRKLQLGMVTVRIYSNAAPRDERTLAQDADSDEHTATLSRPRIVLDALHMAGHRGTVFRGEGRDGPVEMTLATVRRREANQVMDLARQVAPDAFVSIDNDLHPATMSTGDRG